MNVCTSISVLMQLFYKNSRGFRRATDLTVPKIKAKTLSFPSSLMLQCLSLLFLQWYLPVPFNARDYGNGWYERERKIFATWSCHSLAFSLSMSQAIHIRQSLISHTSVLQLSSTVKGSSVAKMFWGGRIAMDQLLAICTYYLLFLFLTMFRFCFSFSFYLVSSHLLNVALVRMTQVKNKKHMNRYSSPKYIRCAFNKFPDLFVQTFKILVDSWKFSMLLLHIWWD